MTTADPSMAGLAQRVDFYPTHSSGTLRLRQGRPFPFGASLVPNGVNFSIFSARATSCTLVLYEKGHAEPFAEVPFADEFRIGNVWSMVVYGIDPERIEYGYRFTGPQDPTPLDRFDPDKVVLDPYAKAVGGRDEWGVLPRDHAFEHRGRLIFEDFDWEDDRPLEIPARDLVIYEMHVRGFTRDPSSDVPHRGTYAGLVSKIPHLKELGVNCVELLPVFEFDEFENDRHHPITGERLYNYWGYSPVGFFAPKSGYSASAAWGMQVDEFKNLVHEFHRNGIEVILDVVFNHTAEGNEQGPTISFRGIDNSVYYMLTPDGYYFNFSGCGNTLNCNHPVVRGLVLDCLRYWVSEYHIDGFRFDLASIMGRGPSGAPLPNPPLLETLAHDPLLAHCKLIAEAWDAGGLYQVGCFPGYGRFVEWNGKYRDEARKFLKGDFGMVPVMAARLQGSPDLYDGLGPLTSVNFFTCHDGFTLRDLVSYNRKHNEANGHKNTDGVNENYSWNCGIEGETRDPHVNALRRRQMKNAWAILMLSQGIPMVLMGDEMGHTQKGNNNAYCQDNELSWINWTRKKAYKDLFRFARNMIRLRLEYDILRRDYFMSGEDCGNGYPELSWHGTQAWMADWSAGSRVLAFMLVGPRPDSDGYECLYAALNMHHDALPFQLPAPPDPMRWHIAINTAMSSPQDSFTTDEAPEVKDQDEILVGGRSVVVLVGK